MMQNKTCAAMTAVALLVTTSACATPGRNPVASISDRSDSSWCQGDREIGYEAANPGEADPDNVLDQRADGEADSGPQRETEGCLPLTALRHRARLAFRHRRLTR